MDKPVEMLRRKAVRYARDSFEEHKEQILGALQIIEQLDCLYGEIAAHFCSVLGGVVEYSKKDIVEHCVAETDAPLKELLVHLLCKESDEELFGECMNEEIMAWAADNKYQGYEWYIAYLYLTGVQYVRESNFGLTGIGTEGFYCTFRTMVPEEWQGEYDRYCSQWIENHRKEILAGKMEILSDRFEEERSVKTAFHRIFGNMDPERIQYIAGELDYKTLAAGTAYAAKPVRNRFLENMSVRQRELVVDEWIHNRYYEYHLNDTLEAMDAILIAAGLTGKA